MSRLVALYPRAWRDRYEDEFLALLQERSPGTRAQVDIVRGAVDARLHPELSGRPEPRRPRSRPEVLTGILVAFGGLGWSAWIGLILRDFRGWGAETPVTANLIDVVSALATLSLTAGIVAIAATFASTMRPLGLLGAVLAGIGFVLSLMVQGPSVLLGFAGVGVLAWSLSSRVIPRWLAVSWIVSTALVVVAFVVFVAGEGRDVRLLALAVPFGIAWLAVGAVMAVGRSPGLAGSTDRQHPGKANDS